MKPIRMRMKEAATQAKVPQYVVEKDYALSYILAGIASQPDLSRSLIFKGGTALKKMIFGQYRFSEDLDFSTLQAPRGGDLFASLEKAAEHSKKLLLEHGPFQVILQRYLERDPHPHEQEAFTLHIQFPWHSSPLCRIKIEISPEEIVILPPTARPLIHQYGDSLSVNLLCYQIPELIAEKMRTLLQTQQKLVTRGWNRPRARDYYDLWHLLSSFGSTLDPKHFIPLLKQKCAHRNVSFQTANDFFTKELLSEAQTHWKSTLGVFVLDLPLLEKVLEELKPLVADLLK